MTSWCEIKTITCVTARMLTHLPHSSSTFVLQEDELHHLEIKLEDIEVSSCFCIAKSLAKASRGNAQCGTRGLLCGASIS